VSVDQPTPVLITIALQGLVEFVEDFVDKEVRSDAFNCTHAAEPKNPRGFFFFLRAVRPRSSEGASTISAILRVANSPRDLAAPG